MNTQTLAANKYLKLRTGGRTILVREIQPGLGQRVERDGVKRGEIRGDTLLTQLVLFSPKDVVCEMQMNRHDAELEPKQKRGAKRLRSDPPINGSWGRDAASPQPFKTEQLNMLPTLEARTADRAIASLRKAIEQLAAGRPRDALAMVANAQDSASELRGMIERLIPL